MASINLKHTSGNGTILNSPAANPSSDITLKLPSTTGSAGQVLKVASANHSSTNAELEFGADTGGKVLQVVQTTKTDSFSYGTITTEFDITGMSVSITPSASNSKVLVTACINYGGSANTYAGIILKDNSTGSFDYTFRADSFTANNGAAAPRFTVTADVINTYKVNNTQIEFLHSPNTTNAITYKLMVYIPYGNFILNRGYTLDNASRSTGTSTITVKEIGA